MLSFLQNGGECLSLSCLWFTVEPRWSPISMVVLYWRVEEKAKKAGNSYNYVNKLYDKASS